MILATAVLLAAGGKIWAQTALCCAAFRAACTAAGGIGLLLLGRRTEAPDGRPDGDGDSEDASVGGPARNVGVGFL